MSTAKRGITGEDLYRMRFVSDPQLSFDGKRVAFAQTIIDEEKEYRSHLFVQSVQEDSAIPITQGEVRDSYPRWSPDDKSICFVSNRSGQSQLWLVSADGGEVRQLTACKHGAREPIWSPNGEYLLFSTFLAEGETFADRETGADVAPQKKRKSPMVVDRLKYKSDDYGYPNGKVRQLAILHVETGEIIPLTHGGYDHAAGSWSPDGEWIACTANRSEDPDRTPGSDLYLISVKGREWKKLTDGTGVFSQPTWSGDGKQIACIGSPADRMYPLQKKIWVYDLESGKQRCITEKWDIHFGDAALGDMRSPGHPLPGAIWSPDRKSVYALATVRGNTAVYQITLDGEVTEVIGGERHLYGLSMDLNSKIAVVAASDPLQPGDLIYVSLTTGEERQLTYSNRELLAELELSPAEEISYQAPDGWTIQGWLMKPVGYQEGKKYPTILQIHGGPHSMYANTFFHEFQLLAAKGYAVLYTNPRGSNGYGEQFTKACCGDYGGKDYLDLMSGVDYALANFDFIDETRLGVTGGSYGGFMTNWIVGQTHRFKAAVTDRSICNWLSFYGVSDIGYSFTEEEIEANLFADPEKLWQHSPIRHVASIETPLLILHGERDYRCPIEQAEQLYVALKHQGKAPVRLIRYPDANHEMSRSGAPELRVHRLHAITDWFDLYL